MSKLVVDTDGDYVLTDPDGTTARSSFATTVYVHNNADNATVEFGYTDETNVFVALTNGLIQDQNVINHGRGAKLMARVTGLTTSTVTILFQPWG